VPFTLRPFSRQRWNAEASVLMLISGVPTHAARPPAAALVGGHAIAALARRHTTEKVSDTTRAIGMPAILDPSPRVCPESSPTIASSPQELGKCDGLKNRRFSLFFPGILAGTRRHRAQCARKCARCREAHPRLRATPQSTHALNTYASKAAVFNAVALR